MHDHNEHYAQCHYGILPLFDVEFIEEKNIEQFRFIFRIKDSIINTM